MMLTSVVLGLMSLVTQPEEDLLKRFGTESQACAQALDSAIKAAEAKNLEDAFTNIDAALAADPSCEMAIYWNGVILGDAGRVDEAVTTYKKLTEGAYTRRNSEDVSGIVIDALNNLGIMEGTRGNLDQSLLHFSRAIQLDLPNRHQYQSKSYRNMAISLYNMQLYWPAVLCAMKSQCINPSDEGAGMVAEFAKPLGVPESVLKECDVEATLIALADADALEEPTVDLIRLNSEKPAAPRPTTLAVPQPTPVDTWNDALPKEGILAAALPGEGNHCYLLWRDSDTAHRIDFASGDVAALSLGRSPACATFVAGKLYVGAQGIGAIDVLDAEGTFVKSYSIPAPPRAIAVCTATNQAFIGTGSTIFQLNLENGDYKDIRIPGAGVCVDSERGVLYALHQPKDRNQGLESGHILINGRPIFFNVHTSSDIQSYQAIVSSIVFDRAGNTRLAGVRTQAASNGYSLRMSPDAKWLAVSGGGGYRGPGGGGYGTAIFSSLDLSFLGGFYATEAYPKSSAFSGDGNFFAAISSNDLRIYKMGNPSNPQSFKGNFGTAAAWSPDGQFLVVSGEEKGFHIFKLAT